MSTPTLTVSLDDLPKPTTEQEYMERIDLIRAQVRRNNELMDAREAESKRRWEKMDRTMERIDRIMNDISVAQKR